ncbi:MAG: DNA repair exonuclease [Candidatus Aminicenantes bacterium]|nr:DNA repair exonuclease [Candidatus Aminicenantes bacterium]
MKAFKFIHASDLHLDSPFRGISEIDPDVSHSLIEATFNAFSSITDLCIKKNVLFLLIAGDIYDAEDRSLRAQLRFRNELLRLQDANIKVFIAHGNHDPLDGWSANLNWPENVHIFSGKKVESVTVEDQGKPVAVIHGISFSTRKITSNLSRSFPMISGGAKDMFSIGMLHCMVQGSSGHEPYSPCSLDDLISKNFDYWALGHIHNRQVLNKEDPVVIYPGNPQGLHPGETGPRGCYLVEVGPEKNIAYEFIETDAVRWVVEEFFIDDIPEEEELLSRLYSCIEDIRRRSEGRPIVCRLLLKGRGVLYSFLAKKGVLDDLMLELREFEKGETPFVWIESLKNLTHPPLDRDSLIKRDDFIGSLLKMFEEISSTKGLRDQIYTELESLYASPGGRKYLEIPDDERLTFMLKKAESICLDRIIRSDS